ncbi:MAG: hypothetical protein HQL69_22485 [Magnetococcales bacterium]|nr:hypothetical protein [Magnetococcales bacterium]
MAIINLFIKLLKIILGLVIFLVVLSVLLTRFGDDADDLATDAEMIKTFQTQKPQYEQLKQMLLADAELYRLSLTDFSPEGAISAERFDAYQKIFTSLDLPERFWVHKEDTYPEQHPNASHPALRFHVSFHWIFRGGTTKGYLFTTTPPTPLENDLDVYRDKVDNYLVYRQLEESWYIFADHVD